VSDANSWLWYDIRTVHTGRWRERQKVWVYIQKLRGQVLDLWVSRGEASWANDDIAFYILAFGLAVVQQTASGGAARSKLGSWMNHVDSERPDNAHIQSRGVNISQRSASVCAGRPISIDLEL
jgi:hypothetical protein